ncbi:hypothetical protein ACFMPD_01955 [Sedimentitalea sp. HM32M-2]|uniref:hypothetical protein n=1 Tax=Sedimentitalea sp. HM32M-2 TaxID=3351566 RepID=UPI0036386DA0
MDAIVDPPAEARALTLRAGRWLALLGFQTRPGAPRFLPGMCSYHDMLDPAAPDERHRVSVRALLPAVERKTEIERCKGGEALAARPRHDPHGGQWRMTERGAALEVTAGLLRDAVKRYRAWEAN